MFHAVNLLRASPGSVLTSWVLLGWLLAGSALSGRPLPITLPADQPLSAFVVTAWTLENGLPIGTLNDILKPDGDYLWIATYSGLLRFDGQRFTAVDASFFPELRASGHLTLAEHRGELWVGTQADGLLRWRGNRFERFGERLPSAHEVTSILVDSTDRVWMTATDSGVYRYEGGKPTPVQGPGLVGRSVYQVLEGRPGAFWFATEGAGVVHLEDDTFTSYSTPEGLPNDRATSLYRTRDGVLWAGTLTGLARISNGRVEAFPELDGTRVNQMLEDEGGNLWIASSQGLLRWSPETRHLEELAEFRGHPLRNLTGMIATEEGNLWFCAHSGGLFQLRASRFSNYTRAQGLATEVIGSVGELDPETRLVGTDNGVIHRIRDDQVSRFELRAPLLDTQIRDIYRDDRDRLWIASDAGLLAITGDQERLYTKDDGLPDDQARLTRQDHQGIVWVGTGGGLARFDEQQGLFRPLTGDSALTSHLILSITDDPEGNLWVGTRGGLLKRSADGELRDYLAGHELPGSLAFSTFSDAAGSVWVCTNRGLARLHDDEITVWSTDHGLPTESLFDYQEDDRGFVWLSSSVGVLRVEKRALVDFMEGRREHLGALVLDDRDGMVNPACTGARKMLRASDGQLWIPTLGGVAVLDPHRLELNSIVPPVVIDGLTFDSHALDLAGEPVIPPGAKRFDLDFSVLSFAISTKVHARYRLEGFDSDWVEAGSQRSARYTNLPPGDYTFHVQAANNDGIWNREGARLRFRVESFFHQTPLFYLLLAGSLALLGGALYHWRIGVFERAERKLRESERRLRLLFSKASDAILIISGGEVVDANGRACEIFGYPRLDLIGCPLARLCPEGDPHSLADAVVELESTRDGGGAPVGATDSEVGIRGPIDPEASPSQYRQIRRDGTLFDSEVSLVALRSSGKLLVQAIIRDVSERVRLIEELGARSLELERFIYTVSHDLKSPLYTIHGFLGLLDRDLREGNTERADQDMERIRAAVSRMGQLLDELLELSRIGRLDNEPQEIAFGELAHQAADLVAGRIAERGAVLDIADDLPHVFGDRARLLAVLQNLIDNAAKFMGDKTDGRIEIATRQDGETTVFFVRDNGDGFDPRYKEKVFGLFEQLNPGREGTGIGLAIVKRVIEVHGGQIWAESEGIGRGSTFCFTLAQDRVVEIKPS